jgi:putative SOS response-associated peptidase YedK
MCGRFNVMTSAQGFVDLLQIMVRIDSGLDSRPNYNVAPTHRVLAVRQESPQHEHQMVRLHWGLIPHWAKDMSIGNRMINARSESAASKPAFRHAYKFSRCLIAADGWYEWRKISAIKQPYNIRRKDGAPMFFAGLWARWRAVNSEAETVSIESCTVLTAEAVDTLQYIHPRMPVVLEPGLYEQWIDSSVTEPGGVAEIIRKRPADIFEAYPVSTYVNKPGNDSSRCVEATSISDADPDSIR